MSCPDVRAELGAFALGGLEPTEDAEVRRHTAVCPSCLGELLELEEAAGSLDAAPPLAAPPPRLKDDVLARLRAEAPPRSRRFGTMVAAVALVLVSAFGFGLALRAEAPAVTVQLSPTPAFSDEHYWGVARFYPQELGNQRIELELNNLDAPGPGRFYEMWLVSGGRSISAGTFTADPRGTRVWLSAPPEARDSGAAVLISVEPAAGGPASSGEVVLDGEVS